MVRQMQRIVPATFFGAAALCLVRATPVPASALECIAPSTWVERTVCGSDELSRLDRTIADGEEALANAADPRFRGALAADGAAWRAMRDGCRKEDYPQACMERLHYRRIDTLAHVTGLVVGPRRFGDPLRGCWQVSETDDHAQACLDAKLADSLGGLAIAAAGVREALAARDGAPDAAGDSLALFEAAEAAFAAHEVAACRSEASALGTGRGRELGETACRIALIRERAVDILRFMPDLATPWIATIGAAREAVSACLDRIGGGEVVGMVYGSDGARLRIETSSGVRQDCKVDATGATVTSVTEVAGTDVAPDEELARFIPGSEDVRPPQCGLVESVRDGSGAIIGRLIVAGC
jgi:uncharacterized protein